ncbi:MAG TPA: RNA polymerase sigma factor [Ktedonobacteraceae bacterium]|nr:RNA polymerase sigma factor [Ktedonobacteraceae bacterium]
MRAHMHVMQREEAMARLYREYAPEILTHLRIHALSQEDAEDILVDVFVAAIENEKFWELPEYAQHLWLWRVARNKMIDTFRRSQRRQGIALEYVEDSLYEDERYGPEFSVVRQEDYDHLQEQVQRLPELQQEILRLRFGLGLPCGEIARRLGKQENAVRVMLSRTLNLLRTLYHRQREGL